jgi:hypothetical protein
MKTLSIPFLKLFIGEALGIQPNPRLWLPTFSVTRTRVLMIGRAQSRSPWVLNQSSDDFDLQAPWQAGYFTFS